MSLQAPSPSLAQFVENAAPRSQLVRRPPSQESLVHSDGVRMHGLVQSNGGESPPVVHAPAPPRSAAQSSVSGTPLGHMVARPFSHVAEAFGVQGAASLSALQASQTAASRDG
jgi:hypothetical protein